ncbi:ATP-binding protein [Desulfobacterales bacterium HSG2]|nr:ATP-binding protein [Desulfobacterales bacterium HSG2]
MPDKSVSLKKSVAASLIKKVFGIYLVIIVIATGIQLAVEYFHVRESIISDIGKMEKTFERGIAEALWNFDERQLQSVVSGMNELSEVVGVRTDDQMGAEAGGAGVILSGEEQVLVTPDGQRIASSSGTGFTPLKGLFSHTFDIHYDDPIHGVNVVGRTTVYSASGIVISRIKYGFFLILINSVIKIAVLWFIIFHFVRRIIGEPLAVLTGTTEKMNPNRPDFFETGYSAEEERLLRSEDELGVLTRSFDRMRNAILERMDNLNRIRNIGEDLAVISEIPAAFGRIMRTMTEKFGFGSGSLFLTEDRNLFEMAACHSDTGETVTGAETFRMGEGVTGKAAERGEAVYMPDSAEEGASSGSVLCVPLTDESGLSGVMNFCGPGGEFGLTDEVGVFLQAVARLTAVNVKNIRMLEDIREKNEELERLDKLKDEFLANTSHELRTPLSGIIGIAESLADGSLGPVTGEQRHNLSLIVSSGRRLTNLVNDILDFSKLKQRDVQLRMMPMDMRSVTDLVLMLSRTLVGTREIRLVNRIGDDLPAARADEDRVQQILHNLVGNAVKFTDAGTVSVSAEVRDEYLAITVSDTGIGIPEESLGRIFKSFEQADGSTAREYGGTGLGLTVTRELVELHGGEIRAESEPGRGSRFTFTLPVSGDKAEPLRAAEILAGDTRVAGISATPAEIGDSEEPDIADIPPERLCEGEMCRILAVDDEPVNLQVLRNQLGSEYYSVTPASGGREALDAVESGPEFDLVLLDVMMPGMSGYEVCRHLREKYPETDLPVLMLTAKNQVDDLVAGFEAGANDYLAKPFSREELLARVNTHVMVKSLHQSRMRAETEAKVLSREMELAKNIQTCLLPASPEDVHPDFEIAAAMVPADEVGGDFYEIALDKSGHLWVSIGDVSGHGVTPGLIMMMAQTVHTTVTSTPDQDARTAVVKINEILYKNVSGRLGERHFMTFNALRYLGGGKFEHAGAHLRIIVHRRESGECELIRTRGIYLNFKKDISKPTKNSYFELGEGDVMVLYTDGLTESVRPDGEMLDIGGLVGIVKEHVRLEPGAMKERIMADVLEWCDGKRDDDMTLVIVKRKDLYQ